MRSTSHNAEESLHNEELSAQNVNSAEVEKHCLRLTSLLNQSPSLLASKKTL